MRPFLRTLLWSGPAAFGYLFLLPALGLHLDRRLALVWRLPLWMEPLAWAAALAGAALAVWCAWLFTSAGHGTPNPLAPPAELVTRGPYRLSRNPMMLGGWMLGIGLAILLRSASLLALVTALVAAGVCYVRRIEEPHLAARFGAAFLDYARRTPRWLCLLMLAGGAGALAALGSLSRQDELQPPPCSPAIHVQVKCKGPGSPESWRRSFEEQILPSIREAVAAGDRFTGFTWLEAALPGEPYDFILLFEGKTFADLDTRRIFPHYLALVRRIGPIRAKSLLEEMGALEQSSVVTLARRCRG